MTNQTTTIENHAAEQQPGRLYQPTRPNTRTLREGTMKFYDPRTGQPTGSCDIKVLRR